MRHVVPSREVYHLWANQTQPDARNSSSSVSFRDSTAYSYRAPIARHAINARGERAVLFGTERYSVTTAKHQRFCSSAIPDGVPVFHVPDMGGAWGSDAPGHVVNLKHYSDNVARLQGKAKRARTYGAYYAEDALKLQQEANEYCRFFGIAEAFDAATLANLERAQAEAQALRAAQEREERAQVDAKMREEYAEEASAWIKGEADTLPWNYPDVLLRLKTFGGEVTEVWSVETSKGAQVPYPDAERLYRLLQARDVARGETVGHYTVARVDADALQIGCHYITLAEIERFAKRMGWDVEQPHTLTLHQVRAMFAAQDN